MCGIFGVHNKVGINFDKALYSLNTLTHRGPDSFGEYKDDKIYLGHRRLSIIDLSNKGSQPLISNCGNIILTVNGEIYNYQLLRQKLNKKYEFKSKSDSEVIIYGYLEWGIDKLLDLIDGMYAFSLYDKKNNFLFLVRDRVGIKPLYYFKNESEIIWASEIKAIKSYKDDLQTDLTSLYDYLTYKYIPSPKSLYQNVYKLEPGHYIKLNTNSNFLKKIKFWDLKHTYGEFKNIYEIIEEVELTLRESVKSQMVSDVDVGAFLSSGVDSSLVSKFSSDFKSKISTFTVGYNDYSDETKEAKWFSRRINSKHLEMKLSLDDIETLFDKDGVFFDEPFGDISPQSYFLNKGASQKLKVILTGDGGDELFFGYNEYRRFLELRFIKSFVPFKKMFSKLNQLEKYNKILKSDIEQYSLQKGSVINSVKKDFKNQFNIPEDYDDLWFFKLHYNKDLDINRRIEGLDFKTFLPEHALVRVDRNSMLFGLECRVPFLSNRMIELAFSIDPKYKFHNQNLKFILKKILEKYSSSEYAFSNKKGLTISSSLRKAYYRNWDRNENISMIKKYLEV
jgi:asparagine synthase (glutamine-hydrolysing)